MKPLKDYLKDINSTQYRRMESIYKEVFYVNSKNGVPGFTYIFWQRPWSDMSSNDGSISEDKHQLDEYLNEKMRVATTGVKIKAANDVTDANELPL